jgi:tetratricopeptide (TPR) repeat protein
MNQRSEARHTSSSMVFVSEESRRRRRRQRQRGERKLSFSVIFASGILCAGLAMAAILAVRHIQLRFNPTVENTERLLSMGKPRDAIALLDKMEDGARSDDSKKNLLRGEALFAILVEQLRAEKWGSYGINPDNWLSHPLAAEAEQCFIDAMAASPDDPSIRLMLGNLYREQGRFSDAELILRSMLEIDDGSAEGYLAIGLLYAEGGRLDAAEKALTAAWGLDKGNPKIAKNLAYFYRFYADEPEVSIIWFNRYLNSNPVWDTDVNLIRAELANLLERYPEYERYKVEPGANINRGVGKKFPQKRR